MNEGEIAIGKDVKIDKEIVLQNNSTISFSFKYPKDNDINAVRDVTNALEYIWIFDWIDMK